YPTRVGHGHPTVERRRDLVGNERALVRHPPSPLLYLLPAAERDLAVGKLAVDVDRTKSLQAAAVAGMRVELSGYHASDTRGGESIHTRRRCAVVRAGLEGHVDRRVAHLLTRGFESDALGVRASLALVPTFADHLIVRNHDSPDDRIRVSRPPPPLRELDR